MPKGLIALWGIVFLVMMIFTSVAVLHSTNTSTTVVTKTPQAIPESKPVVIIKTNPIIKTMDKNETTTPPEMPVDTGSSIGGAEANQPTTPVDPAPPLMPVTPNVEQHDS